MRQALYIGGEDVPNIMRAWRTYGAVTVLCSEEERRGNWMLRLPAGLKVMVADALAIDTELQKNFHQAFDAVIIETDDPRLAQKADDFRKEDGVTFQKGEFHD